jgi:signal transduction histidine kinase
VKQRNAARLAWGLWALFVVLAGAAVFFSILVSEPSVTSAGIAATSAFMVAMLAMATVGALIASQQVRNAVGWILLAVAVTAAMTFGSSDYATYALVTRPDSLPGGTWAFWLSNWVWVPAIALPMTFLLLLFPHGRLPSPRWRPFAWLAGTFLAFVAVVFALDPGRFVGLPVSNPIGVAALEELADFLDGEGFVLFLAFMLVSLSSLVVRFRRAGGTERQQIKWFASAGVLAVALFVAQAIADAVGASGFLWVVTISAAYLALPVGIGIAILRHRLYDIDLVINRTVLFALLVAFITAVYVAIVVGIGTLVGTRSNLLLSILATALIALVFQPVRERARHFANRLVYGKRATPYEVLSEFSQGLGGAYSTEDILPRLSAMVGEATGARRVRLWLRVGSQLRPVAAWPAGEAEGSVLALQGDQLPDFPGEARAFPVLHQGELLGALTVSMPAREALGQTQERLLENLGAQAGLVLRNARLIEELRASRQRLVTAQDQERRRLERNIHDGAQQQLVALAVKLRLARTVAGRDPDRADELLGQLQTETQETLEDLRDLARGIYPPLLADQGLAAALEAQSRKVPFPVEVQRDGVGRYPAEAEATAYFCVLEALQNASKYAEAAGAVISLREEDGSLVFSVSDDGRGFDLQTTARGAGLQNMADRLEALGGRLQVDSSPGSGTMVTGRIPVAQR